MKLRAHLYVLGAMALYGANYSIAKIALGTYLQPFGFVAIRVVFALILIYGFHTAFIKESISNRDLPRVALCAVFGVIGNQLFFLKGLSMTSEIHASLIMITTPIIILLLSFFVLRERITWSKGIGVALGAAGVCWLILQGEDDNSAATPLGDLFILINATSYAVYLVLVKPLMVRYHPITIIKWLFFFGLFVIIPVGYKEAMLVQWSSLPAEAWFSVIYVVVGATFLTYLGNALAIRELDAAIVGIYIYLQPFLAAVIAVSIGNDVMTLQKLLSGALVISGVVLASGLIRFETRK